MYDPSAVYYMSKLVTGPEAASIRRVDIDAPPAVNIAAVAGSKNCSSHDVTVVILDRPRHAELIAEVRAAGARIKLLTDGDVAGAIMAAREGTGVDLLLGIGGTPEGIIAACAIKCLGGVILGKLAPRDDAERAKALDAGHDLSRVLSTDDLVTSDDAFFAATGITDGELLAGVRYRSGGATTHSLVMRARSGTVRNIYSEHQLWKLSAYSAVDFRRMSPGVSTSRAARSARGQPWKAAAQAAQPAGALRRGHLERAAERDRPDLDHRLARVPGCPAAASAGRAAERSG